MNRIITTDILDPIIQQPLTGNSVDFWQDATKEISLGLAQSIIGDTYNSATPYVLKGLTAYGTGNYTEGYILYQGEIYYSAGKSNNVAMVNIPVMTLTITNDATADPVTFTDGTPRNVHKVRRMVLSDALTGTGTFDLSTAVFIQAATDWTEFAITAVTNAAGGGFDPAPGATLSSVNALSSFRYIKTGKTIQFQLRYYFTISGGGGAAQVAVNLSSVFILSSAANAIFSSVAVDRGLNGDLLNAEIASNSSYLVIKKNPAANFAAGTYDILVNGVINVQ